MSLKSIDTQLSLSRTKDVGAIQNQLNHKPTDDQVSLAALAQKRMEDDRKKLSKASSKSSETSIKDQQSPNQQGQANTHHGKNHLKTEEQSHPTDHPYKGHRIDISL
ncbi:MAG: hypothetical protein WDZ91_13400 [Paenibacillaceae bacterium]